MGIYQSHHTPRPGSNPGRVTIPALVLLDVSPPTSVALREGGAFYEHPNLGWAYRAHEGKLEFRQRGRIKLLLRKTVLLSFPFLFAAHSHMSFITDSLIESSPGS